MAMSKEVFKARWEADENGDGITFEEIAECAIAWGITPHPYAHDQIQVSLLVLAAAGTTIES